MARSTGSLKWRAGTDVPLRSEGLYGGKNKRVVVSSRNPHFRSLATNSAGLLQPRKGPEASLNLFPSFALLAFPHFLHIRLFVIFPFLARPGLEHSSTATWLVSSHHIRPLHRLDSFKSQTSIGTRVSVVNLLPELKSPSFSVIHRITTSTTVTILLVINQDPLFTVTRRYPRKKSKRKHAYYQEQPFKLSL